MSSSRGKVLWSDLASDSEPEVRRLRLRQLFEPIGGRIESIEGGRIYMYIYIRYCIASKVATSEPPPPLGEGEGGGSEPACRVGSPPKPEPTGEGRKYRLDHRLTRVVVTNMDSMHDVIIMANKFDYVQDFKAKIALKFSIPVEAQKLTLRTLVLEDGGLLDHFYYEQSERWLHVRDMRIGQLFVTTANGRHAPLDYVPSLPVGVFKQRIQTITGLEYSQVRAMRLTFGGRELNDDSRTLSDYGLRDESTVHLSIRIVGGSESEDEDEDEDHGSHEDFYDGDTDDTASADSLPTDSDGSLHNHRDVRVMTRFAAYTAPSPVEDLPVPSSQATTLRYVASPDGEGEGGGSEPACRVGSPPKPDPEGPAESDGEEGVSEPACRVGPPSNPEDPAPEPKRRRLTRHRANEYQIFVRCDSAWLVVWVCALDTVAYTKTQIIDAMQWAGVSPMDLRLVTGIRDLDNERSLSDYNIREHANLWVLPRMRGGANNGLDDSDGDAMHDLSQEQQGQVVHINFCGSSKLPPQVLTFIHFF